MTYGEYLQSPWWKRRRRNYLIAHQYRCESCGLDCSIRQRRAYINVHHKTYDRLGCEDAGDLEALCRNCHREEHNLNDNVVLALNIMAKGYGSERDKE